MAVLRLSVAFAALCVLGPASARGAILIDGYGDATNDRFTNSPSFIAAPYDLSGVGKTVAGRWATLISPNVIVSANHLRPQGDVQFFVGNVGGAPAVSRQITGDSQRIGSSDLWLARLSAPVDTSIAVYAFARFQLAGPPGVGETIFPVTAGPYQNVNGFVSGNSPRPTPALQNSHAIGRNLISGYAEEVTFLDGTVDSLLLNYDRPGDAAYTQYESLVQGGDSGAPFFIDQGGELLLLGINSFQLTQGVGGPAVGSGINYTGNYATQIDAFVASATAVPEPASIAVLVTALAAAGWRAPGFRFQGSGFRKEAGTLRS